MDIDVPSGRAIGGRCIVVLTFFIKKVKMHLTSFRVHLLTFQANHCAFLFEITLR